MLIKCVALGVIVASVIFDYLLYKNTRKFIDSFAGGQQNINNVIFTMIERINKDVFDQVLDEAIAEEKSK